MSKGMKIGLVVAAVAVVGVLGFLYWKGKQTASALKG